MDEKIRKLEDYFKKSIQVDESKKNTYCIKDVEKFTTDDAVRLAYLQFEFEVERSDENLTIYFKHNPKIRIED